MAINDEQGEEDFWKLLAEVRRDRVNDALKRLPEPPAPPVAEEPPHFDVTKLGCFKQVCKTLKYNDAVYELEKVGEENFFVGWRGNSLINAFGWDRTPQKHAWWSDIHNYKRVPYDVHEMEWRGYNKL